MTPYQQGEAAAKHDLNNVSGGASIECPYWAESQFKEWLGWNEGYITTYTQIKDSPTMERTHDTD